MAKDRDPDRLDDFEQLRTFKEIAELAGSEAFSVKRLQRWVREAVDTKQLAEMDGKKPPEHVRRLLECVVVVANGKKFIHLGRWEEYIAWTMTRPVQ